MPNPADAAPVAAMGAAVQDYGRLFVDPGVVDAVHKGEVGR